MAVRLKSEDDMDVVFPELDYDDDEIVQEINVFLSPGQASGLYLLQYPLQQDRGSSSVPQQARIKPKHGLLEMSHDLPRTMFSMDSSPHYGMKERTFTSHTVPLQTHMCLGHLQNNTLQLFPLNHIAQMRPSLDHINTDMEAQETKEPDNDTKKPVVFQRRESERAAMARRSSYAYKKSSEEAEEWNDLHVNAASSIHGDASHTTSCVLPRNSNHMDYLESLNYMLTTEPSKEAPTQTGLVKQMTELLHKGLPVPFSILRLHAPDSDDFEILEALSFCAVQVHGNYLLNSQRLVQWTKENQRARTLILLLLQQKNAIERPRLQKALRIPSPTTDDILRLVAKKTTAGWVLKIEPDTLHVLDYAKNQDLHLKYWERQAQRFQRELKIYDSPLK